MVPVDTVDAGCLQATSMGVWRRSVSPAKSPYLSVAFTPAGAQSHLHVPLTPGLLPTSSAQINAPIVCMHLTEFPPSRHAPPDILSKRLIPQSPSWHPQAVAGVLATAAIAEVMAAPAAQAAMELVQVAEGEPFIVNVAWVCTHSDLKP